MGHMRMLVEQSMKDVMVLLQRNKISPELVVEVKHVLNKTLIQGCLREEAFHLQTSKAAPPGDICTGILLGIVDDVVTRIVPQRQVSTLEDERAALLREQWVLQTEVNSCQSIIQVLSGQLRRGAASKDFALESYFKEVYLLRQQIAELTTIADNQHEALVVIERGDVVGAMKSTSGMLDDTVTPVNASNRGGPLGQRILKMAQIATDRRRSSTKPLQVEPPNINISLDSPAAASTALIPVFSSVAGTPIVSGGNNQLGITPFLGGGSSSNLLGRSPSSVSLHASSLHASSLERVASLSTLRDPPAHTVTSKGANQNAIFDYQKYIDLQNSTGLNVLQKYEELQMEFETYKVWIQSENNKTAAFTAQRIDAKNAEIASLREDLRVLRDNVEYFRNVNRRVIEDLRTQLNGVKRQLKQGIDDMKETAQSATGSLEHLAVHDELLLKYIKAANTFLVVQLTSNTGEKISRDAFQQALHLGPDDSDVEKRSKLYWRQHPITASILSAIVAVRQSTSGMKESIKRAKLLSDGQVKQQQEQLDAAQRAAEAGNAASSQAARLSIVNTDDSSFAGTRASTSEVIKFATQRSFLFGLFDKAKDAKFDMLESNRTLIFSAMEKYKALVKSKHKLIFSRIHRRSVNQFVRTHFETTMLTFGLDRDSVAESLVHLKEVSVDAELKVTDQCHSISTTIDSLAHQLISSLDREFLLRAEINNPRKEVPGGGKAAATGFKTKAGYVDAKTRLKRIGGAVSAPTTRRRGTSSTGGATAAAASGGDEPDGNSESNPGGRVSLRNGSGGSRSGPGGQSVVRAPDGSLVRMPTVVEGAGRGMTGVMLLDQVVHLDNDLASEGSEGGMRIKTLMPAGRMMYIPSLGGIGSSSTQRQSMLQLANAATTAGSAQIRPRPQTGTSHPLRKPAVIMGSRGDTIGTLPPMPPKRPTTGQPKRGGTKSGRQVDTIPPTVSEKEEGGREESIASTTPVSDNTVARKVEEVDE